jgi:hypothetical protein
MNRLLPVFTLVVASCLMVGCGHAKHSKSGVSGPGMNVKREAQLLALASGRMSCPEQSLVPAFVESSEKNLHLYRVAGCNATFNALLHCIAGVCNWVEMPDQRAAQEMACPVEQLQVKYMGDATYSYTGCGKSANYAHRKLHWEGGVTQ